MLSRAPRWSGPWMCLLHVPLYCGDVLLGVLVGSKCLWHWVLFGIRERLHLPVLYILDWPPWWVGAHVGPWRLGWTRFMLLNSWGGFVCYCYHNHIKQMDTCFPYWMLQGVYLWGLWLFTSCGWRSWRTLCWCIVSVISSVDPPVSWALVTWSTWCYSLSGECGPWMLTLIGANAC